MFAHVDGSSGDYDGTPSPEPRRQAGCSSVLTAKLPASFVTCVPVPASRRRSRPGGRCLHEVLASHPKSLNQHRVVHARRHTGLHPAAPIGWYGRENAIRAIPDGRRSPADARCEHTQGRDAVMATPTGTAHRMSLRLLVTSAGIVLMANVAVTVGSMMAGGLDPAYNLGIPDDLFLVLSVATVGTLGGLGVGLLKGIRGRRLLWPPSSPVSPARPPCSPSRSSASAMRRFTSGPW